VGTTSSTEGERKKVISKSKISSRVFLLFLRILLSGLLLLFFFFVALLRHLQNAGWLCLLFTGRSAGILPRSCLMTFLSWLRSVAGFITVLFFGLVGFDDKLFSNFRFYRLSSQNQDKFMS
jgi:hypothetical protein